MLLKHVFISLFVFIIFSVKSQDLDNWKLVSNNERIIIYQKDTIQKVKEFLVELTTQTDSNVIKNTITDVSNYTSWINSVKEIKTIKDVGDSLKYFHIRVGLENIFEREGIIKYSYKIINNEKIFEIELDTINYQSSIQKKKTKYFKAKWIVKSHFSKTTEVKLLFISNIDEYYDFIYSLFDKVLLYSLQSVSESFIKEVEN